jgi:hypothetical protein
MNTMAIPMRIPRPMAAPVIALGPEGCVSAAPDRGLELLWLILVASVVAEAVGFVIAKLVGPLVGLPVFGIPCTVSIFCYESMHPGEVCLISREYRCLDSNCISVHSIRSIHRDNTNCDHTSCRHSDRKDFVCIEWSEATQSRLPIVVRLGLALEAAGGIDKSVNIVSKDEVK